MLKWLWTRNWPDSIRPNESDEFRVMHSHKQERVSGTSKANPTNYTIPPNSRVWVRRTGCSTIHGLEFKVESLRGRLRHPQPGQISCSDLSQKGFPI